MLLVVMELVGANTQAQNGIIIIFLYIILFIYLFKNVNI